MKVILPWVSSTEPNPIHLRPNLFVSVLDMSIVQLSHKFNYQKNLMTFSRANSTVAHLMGNAPIWEDLDVSTDSVLLSQYYRLSSVCWGNKIAWKCEIISDIKSGVLWRYWNSSEWLRLTNLL